MRIVVSLVALLLFSLSLKAQKVYFIYLESESRNPFYAKVGDNVLSSNAAGFLTIPNLTDSTYQLAVGFPNGASISRFTVTINSKDRGFIIKSQDNQYILFDFENSSVIKPIPDPSKSNISYDRRTDEFTTLLSKAANDTTLLYVAVAEKQEVPAKKEEKQVVIKPPIKEPEKDTASIVKKDEPKQPVVNLKKDSAITFVPPPVVNTKKDSAGTSTAALTDTTHTITKTPDIKKEENTIAKTPDIKKEENTPVKSTVDSLKTADAAVYKKSKVIRHSESSTSEGFGLVFFDNSVEGTDTIRMLIPNPKYQLKQNDEGADAKDFLDVKPKTGDNSIKKTDSPTSKTNADSAVKKQETTAVIKRVRPVCEHMADNNDFLKLRKNMAAKTNDEGMITEARKYFRTKCFTTEQVKNLSTLFLTAAGKYGFFDAAYQHVADQQQFATLQNEIKDDYYFKRFKALVGE
jgi:hypothetical protein